MEIQDIIISNKLIAKFMKYDDVDCYNCKYTRDCNWIQCGLTPQEKDEQLKFHSSWDWLMPVIEKIEKLSTRAFDYRYFDSDYNRETYEVKGYYFTHSYSPLNKTFKVDSNSKLHACWIICVEFIKWFNEQQKENM